jgi:hypothetical protein
VRSGWEKNFEDCCDRVLLLDSFSTNTSNAIEGNTLRAVETTLVIGRRMRVWKTGAIALLSRQAKKELRYFPLTYDITRIMLASDASETEAQD